MAKNVIITEDGQTKTISNATRIRTALESGGTCDWIPKDDVPLQELTVTEDGVYDPEEGYYGFSQVTANGVGTVVEGTLIEKTVTKNGTYNITDESGNPYGYSKITVNVDTSDDDSGGGSGGGGSNPVVGKDDDGNDTMAEADDDGNIVMTALPTEIKVIIPPTKLKYNRYEQIDYSGISVYAYISKAVHWLGTTTTIVSEGSSNNTVSIGGNSVTASIGDGVLYAPDRTGSNDIQLVWNGTKWVKSGNYSAEKAIWKSEQYPTGKIPFGELIFPAKRINVSLDETEDKNDIIFLNNVLQVYKRLTLYSTDIEYSIEFSVDEDAYILPFISTDRSDTVGLMILSKTKNSAKYLYYNTQTIVANPYSSDQAIMILNAKRPDGVFYEADTNIYERTFRNTTLYYTYAYFNPLEHGTSSYLNILTIYTCKRTSGAIFTYTIGFRPTKGNNSSNIPLDSALGILGTFDRINFTKSSSCILPVQWKRPGDGKILETTFTAWMTDGGDNNASAGNTRPGGPNIDVPQ